MAYYNIVIIGDNRPNGAKYRNLNDNSLKKLNRILKAGDRYVNVYRRLDRKGSQTVFSHRIYIR